MAFLKDLDPKNIPSHVAIIMDGNGRWARSRLQPRLFGHKKGVDALKKAIDYAIQVGISYLSAWAFSTANWKRPDTEIAGLMSILTSTLENDLDAFHKKNVRLRVIGFLDELPPHLQTLITQAEATTKDNTALTLIIHFNYDGRRDIIKAIKEMDHNTLKNLTEDSLSSHLLTANIPDPDLMIRTSNVQRLSNYMLWQLSFTEFVFLEKNWPDFTQEDFHQAVLAFQNIERKFGHISKA